MSKSQPYQPPFNPTSAIIRLVAEICELLASAPVWSSGQLTPQLRRENRIQTIQASLAIENNSLTLEQVTAVIEGKHVRGLPTEILEVQNAFITYEAMKDWRPASIKDLLTAHHLLMTGLMEKPGQFRSGDAGVFQGKKLVHAAPPAKQLPRLMGDLMTWLERTNDHPLIAGCLFHYELEFIHPFADGNGRMGRLWQTLILRAWKPQLAYLPVESVIRNRQQQYYKVLSQADKQADAAPVVAFLLSSLQEAILASQATDQVTGQVTDQVTRLLKTLNQQTLGASALMSQLGLEHRPTFRTNYLNPALAAGLIERTDPDSPRSPKQQYRLTPKGLAHLNA